MMLDTAGGTVSPARRVLRPGLYIAGVLLALVAAFVAHMRLDGVLSCPASGYYGDGRGDDRYLGYCNGAAYGDFDHGAVWFDLEPGTWAAAAGADVLVLGNSRVAFGFSSPELGRWAAETGITPYVLGFSHNETAGFTGPLLDRIRPAAKAYVINVDKFFYDPPSPPAEEVMHSPDARGRYLNKQTWQRVHQAVCGPFPGLCGANIAYYRDRATGEWALVGSRGLTGAPVTAATDDPGGKLHSRFGEDTVARATEFVAALGARGVAPDCVILTYVPSTENNRSTAEAIAAGVGLPLVAPSGVGLTTFDDSHLDPASAGTWTRAFLAEAGPRLAACLEK